MAHGRLFFYLIRREFAVSIFLCISCLLANAQSPSHNYNLIQKKLQSGWGTFNTNSVLSHVLLPVGFSLNIGVKMVGISTHGYLRDAFISSRDKRPETIIPGNHALDGSYTDLIITWNDIKFRVQSAVTESGNIVLLISPLELTDRQVNIILEAGMLWNKSGRIVKSGNSITAFIDSLQIRLHAIGDEVSEVIPATSSYLALQFNKEVAFYTGPKQSLQSVKSLIKRKREILDNEFLVYGKSSETYRAMQNVIAWNTIYDAAQNRVITPVSRLWNKIFGGQSVLFCWDTYFVSYMASLRSKELAYANAIEITKSITPNGFVPNWAGSYRNASFDRSQPPVGSLIFKELYRKFNDKWLLEYVFDDLMKWNRWWEKNRDRNGFLCWGSNKVDLPHKGDEASNGWQGAAYESGLDNSPMYDDIPFNTGTSLLELGDVGLMSLYILDCQSLAEIANLLNRKEDQKELLNRANKYKGNISKLWNEEAGCYLNIRTDINVFSNRLSPTNFYPFLTKIPTNHQANLMINKHLLNPEEFNSKWMIPSISINDSAYKDQKYWRGRIWGPMNFLVYLGLINYDFPEARKLLVEKSNQLFLQNSRISNWVFENYNGITGNITDQEEGRSEGDNYYHWGGLLGFIYLIENGFVPNPSLPLGN